MPFRGTIAVLLGIASLAVAAPIAPPMPPPLPAHSKASLLYVRFVGPAGLRATFFQGQTKPYIADAPVTVGLRPGYFHRVGLSGWTDHPGLVLYPTLEVRGTLCLPHRQSAASYPVNIVITEQDLACIAAGSLITKVIYLECPDLAPPIATKSDDPLELTLPKDQDPLIEARERGRPMLIVRFGQREVSAEELARATLAGTVLLPGERAMTQPARPPFFPWASWPVYDPILGPRPETEECLHDGGDIGLKAALGPHGRARGVDPSDTVAEYKDCKGQPHLAISNRVCLCVPRYAVLRAECPLARSETLIALDSAKKVVNQTQIEMRVPSVQAEQVKPVAAMVGRKQPTVALNVQGTDVLKCLKILESAEIDIGPAIYLCTTGIRTLKETQRAQIVRQIEMARELDKIVGTQEVVQTQGTSVLGKVVGLDMICSAVATRDITVCCDTPCPPDKPLVLFKWVCADSPQVGDVVTFCLKYSNHGGKPMSDVAVIDSLTSRLEYVPGSAKSNRPAVFTTQENEAGSVILRWEISGQLPPGENGVVSFQAKIR